MYTHYQRSFIEQLPQETWNLIIYGFQSAALQALESVSKKFHSIIKSYRIVMANYGKEISLLGVKNACHFAIKNRLWLFKMHLDESKITYDEKSLIDNNLLKEIGKI